MNCFSDKRIFAIEYEKLDEENASFELWVNQKPVCSFDRKGIRQVYQWNLYDLVLWLEQNMDALLYEKDFPLPIEAKTSLEFWHKSAEFDTDDMSEFDRWYDTRQDWQFRHSWFHIRGGSYLADILFRRVGDTIEIEWDNTNLYDEVSFITPKGIYYVDVSMFQG